ncbi:MAG: HAD-IA family hydrolase [Dehalococcoidales bacterium]|nr:HAD-IA family hydrolase [Dehalococcoidales bacterium]
MKTRSVLFDFDYTLADSSRGAIECAAYALENLGFSVPSDEEIRKTIGMSLAATFDTLAGEMPSPPHEEFTRLFVEQADRIMLDRIVLFDEVVPMIRELLAKDILLGIVSTKYRYRIQACLEREKLADSFSVIVGGEDIAVHKPDPTGLLIAMDNLGISPGETVYVGDSIVDAETAERAGVRFVAVLTGVTPGESFSGYQPFAVLNDLTALAGILC